MEEKVILSRLLRTYEVAAHDVEFSHGMRPNIDTQSTSAFYVEKKMNICPCVPMRGSLKSFVFLSGFNQGSRFIAACLLH